MSDSSQPDNGGDAGQPSRWARPKTLTIRCRENGPLVLELPSDEAALTVRVIDHEGGEFRLPGGQGPLPEGPQRPVALCRCGHSAKKPFCDGSHRSAGFRAAERAREGD